MNWLEALPKSFARSAIYMKGMKKPTKQRNPLKDSNRNDGLFNRFKSNISVKVLDGKQTLVSIELMVAFDSDICWDDFSLDSFMDLIELNFVLLSNVWLIPVADLLLNTIRLIAE